MQHSSRDAEAPHLALFMRSLAGGGVERSMLNLAAAFMERGHRRLQRQVQLATEP